MKNIFKKLWIPLLAFVILASLSTVFFFFSPKELISKLPLVGGVYNNTSLSVNTKNGVAKVEVDGKANGQTPVSISSLPEGQHKIKLTRISESKGFYKDHTIFVDLYRGTESFIDVEIGPDDVLAGSILYYSKAPALAGSKGFITVTTVPKTATVLLDEEFFANAPVKAKQLNANDYKLKVKADGYEDLEIPVIVRENYNLNVTVYLLPIPVIN